MKYQYQVLSFATSDSMDVEKDLDRSELQSLFEEGWELISVVGPASLKTARHPQREQVMLYYLRRAVDAVGRGGV